MQLGNFSINFETLSLGLDFTCQVKFIWLNFETYPSEIWFAMCQLVSLGVFLGVLGVGFRIFDVFEFALGLPYNMICSNVYLYQSLNLCYGTKISGINCTTTLYRFFLLAI